jgi:hypothetical protein
MGLLAAVVFAMRCATLKRRAELAAQAGQHIGAALVVAGVSALVAGASWSLLPMSLASGLLLLVLIGFYETCDYTSFRYFGTPLSSNIRHLPFSLRSEGAMKCATAYLRQYFPISYLLLLLVALLAFALLLHQSTLPVMPTAMVALLFTAAGTILLRRRRREPLDGLSRIERCLVDAEIDVPAQPLRGVPRAVHLTELRKPPPHTILIIINESIGRHMPAAESRCRLLSDRIREIGGDPSAWFAPTNAVTNSSCTDISIPSILTGSAPHESIAKLHAMPFVFDLAKARGYQTALFTSSILGWAGFSAFFDGARIDQVFSAETAGRPYVNDLAIDDIVPARELAARLQAAEGPVLAVLYSNALHVPFQRDSECGIPHTITRRRDRATYIVEEIHRVLFDALKTSGRYDPALIITLGDHGETLGNVDNVVEQHMARTTDLHDCIVRPLFLVKPPHDLPTEAARALRVNHDRLVANLDVAPTIARILGAEPADGLSYAGHSLFEEIPADRVAYLLNTNEWRFWSRGAVGVFRSGSRIFVDYLNDELCRYVPGEGASYQEREELLASACSIPLIQRSISRIYRDKLGLIARGVTAPEGTI